MIIECYRCRGVGIVFFSKLGEISVDVSDFCDCDAGVLLSESGDICPHCYGSLDGGYDNLIVGCHECMGKRVVARGPSAPVDDGGVWYADFREHLWTLKPRVFKPSGLNMVIY